MQGMRVTEVLLNVESLNSGSVVILDLGRKSTPWARSIVISDQPHLGYSQFH